MLLRYCLPTFRRHEISSLQPLKALHSFETLKWFHIQEEVNNQFKIVIFKKCRFARYMLSLMTDQADRNL